MIELIACPTCGYKAGLTCAASDMLRTDLTELETLRSANAALRALLKGASHALRSYQYGNSAPDLAEELADGIDAALATPNIEETPKVDGTP